MSRYLIAASKRGRNVTVRAFKQIVALEGDGHLERVQLRDARTNETETPAHPPRLLDDRASPNTAWLKGAGRSMARARQDRARPGSTRISAGGQLPRAPFLLETSIPGVFAVGDVRAGSVKRVASAVGEGSACVQLVHRVLAE